jgi:hypothetical protein
MTGMGTKENKAPALVAPILTAEAMAKTTAASLAQALKQLATPPVAGQGVHNWLFATACSLHEAGIGRAEKMTLLRDASHNVGRKVPDREISGAIIYAEKKARPTTGFSDSSQIIFAPPEPAWPEPDYRRVYLMAKDGPGLYDLWEQSPVRFDDEETHVEEVIDALFPGNPLLCVGKSNYQFATRRREIWRGHLENYPLIVPNPMLCVSGLTAEGKQSEHTKAATARRVYLVTEFDISRYARDGATLTKWAHIIDAWELLGITVADACATIILLLAFSQPLVCVVHSGGKSLHAWFRVFNEPEPKLKAFMRSAVVLGADHATWTASQFVRVPGGRRENGTRQVTYYLDPTKAIKL